MHTLTLRVQDSVVDKIIYFLSNLPKNEVEILEDKVIKDDQNKKCETQDIFVRTSGLLLAKKLDPLAWQQSIRNEWK